MQIDITTPALFFPAISLLLVAYTNRFLAMAHVVRDLSAKRGSMWSENIEGQILILRKQLKLIKAMKAFALASLILCVICMFVLFNGYEFAGRVIFGGAMIFMVISLMISFRETLLNGAALTLELKRIEHHCTEHESAS